MAGAVRQPGEAGVLDDGAAAPWTGGAPRDVRALLRQRLERGSRPGHRSDGARVVLAIEGGGMRGVVSGGMALAVHELGLLPAVDAVYGASAGSLNGVWLVSSTPREGLEAWTHPLLPQVLLHRRNALRGRPVVDVEHLVEVAYRDRLPLDSASVLASPVPLHPLATDAVTGVATDLHPHVRDDASLRLALRASAALPLLAGPPVALGGRTYVDAGLTESLPFRSAVAAGATHLVVLRSRLRRDEAELAATRTAPRVSRLLAATAMRRLPPAVRSAYLGRSARLDEADRDLLRWAAAEDEQHDGDGSTAVPGVLVVHPEDGCPRVGRLQTDRGVLLTAFESGRAAVHRAWAGD